jgi:hypothetical protein
MLLSIHTAAVLRQLETQPNLHKAEKRQPFAKTEEGLNQFSQAIDTFYPTLDESESDGAKGEKGLVRYHTGDGQRIQARYQGDSQQGHYVQEWINGGFMLTKFSQSAVDNYQVGPRGSHHVHLDRNDASQSFVTVEGAGYPLLAGEPAPASSPAMPADKTTTESGLSYAILRPGQGGEFADKGEAVLVHYTGWLENGSKFDSSRDKGSPFNFPVGGGRVIKGWDQGVEGMQAGEKRLLHIPANLAYGERARGSIPANSPLIFEVELLATSGEVGAVSRPNPLA